MLPLTYGRFPTFRQWIEYALEALVWAGIFFIPFYNEALVRGSFALEMPYCAILFRAAMALWLLKKIAYREPVKSSRAVWALWLFAGWTALGLMLGSPAGPTAAGRLVFWRFAESAALFMFSADFFFENASRRRRLLDFFLFWMLIVCASGAWQMLSPAGRDFLAGRPVNVAGEIRRMTGPFGSPNGLATFLLLAIPLAFQKMVSHRPSLRAAVWAGIVGFFSLCLIATLSRGGFLALWLTTLAFCVWQQRWIMAGLALAAAPAIAFFSGHLRQNFFLSMSASDITISYRLRAWKLAWQTLWDHPIEGIGPGALQDILRAFSPHSHHFTAFAHNSYLEIAAESGWPGLLLFSAAIILGLFFFVRPGSRSTPLSSAVRFGLTAIAVHAFFDVDFQRYKMLSLFWLFAGLLCAERTAQDGWAATVAFLNKLVLSVIYLSLFAVAAALPFLQSFSPWKNWLLNQAPYFLLWILASCWIWAVRRVITRSVRSGIMAVLRKSWRPLAAIFIAVAAVFCLVKPQFRVFSDEANLLAVSKAMAGEGRLDYVMQGYWEDGRYVPVNRIKEIRPFGFPFMVHAVHLATGFRPANAFAVNFILLAGVLSLIFGLVRRFASTSWALAVVFAVLAQPLVLVCATSGGFELFQVFWIGVALASCLFYLEAPQNEPRFRLAWLSLIVLAHARYESALFFLAVIPALLFARKFPVIFFRTHPVYALSLAFLLPLFWQRLAFADYHPVTLLPGTPLWSADALIRNLRLFAGTIVHPRLDWLYNPFLNALGLASIFWGAWQLRRGVLRPPPNMKAVFLSFGTAASLCIAGLAAYAESGLDLPQSSRYFLLGSIILSVSAVIGVRSVFRGRMGRMVAAVCFILFILFLPVARANRHWNENLPNAEYRFVKQVAARMQLDPRRTVFIVRRPVVYASQGYGALYFGRVRSNPTLLTKIRDTSPDLRIFAVREKSSGTLSKETRLPTGWRVERIARRKHPSGKVWEISELK